MPLADAWDMLDLISVIIKISVILMALLLVLSLCKRQSASRKVLAGQLSILALLGLPMLWWLLPSAPLSLPLAISAISDAPLQLPDLPGIAYISNSISQQEEPHLLNYVLLMYAAISTLLLLKIGFDILRLRHLLKHSAPLSAHPTAPHIAEQWTSKLHQLRGLYQIDRPVQLMWTARLRAPVSWGLLHPVILLDQATLVKITDSDQSEADDILRHELAHIAHFDWLSLILARLVAALYWFHPLMWLMLKDLQFNMECAADDRVLKSGGTASGYAQTLLQVSRQAEQQRASVNALAAKGKSLMARIMAIIEPHRQRTPVSKSTWLISLIVSLLILLPLAAISFTGEQLRWPYALFEQTLQMNQANQHGKEHLAGNLAASELDKLNNPNFTALAQALRHADFQHRHALEVASFKQRAAIPALVLALHDQRPAVRRLALWGLSEMAFQETSAVIAIMLNDQDPYVRAEAARALGDFATRNWSARIAALLQDPHPFVRANAAHALGDLADKRSLPALQKSLNESDPQALAEIRWAIAEIL
ncbi:HEAT repeat domain-containing protein [Undibacterium seohonense]|uniref:HEAT repeat domain-containing protein n=1 Tax=Undibacterium seohonense TaxID=1344950 RepID=A0ABR6X2R9_9BURK|nr:M56 family metallopeptidase [Undibacterium seohonense]MBC3807217.1 HEAT repeat domain-containing protein [Undibacterium seohonense]